MAVRLDQYSGAVPNEKTGAAEAASGLEALLLRRLLSEMKVGQTGFMDGGYAGRMFHDLLNEAMANAVAQAGGVGIAPLLEEQFGEGSGPTGHTPASKAARKYMKMTETIKETK